ncbi:hypothetical protein IIC44_03185 [Patescibacteria group bacterium]|nr:hypothetical protein [Patescibacteria group bacterium]
MKYKIIKMDIGNRNFHFSSTLRKITTLFSFRLKRRQNVPFLDGKKIIGIFGVYGPLEKTISRALGIRKEESFLIQDSIYFAQPSKGVKGVIKNLILYSSKHRFEQLAKIFVSGEYTKRKFIGEGVDERKIIDFGIPRFQSLKNLDTLPRCEISHLVFLCGAWAWHGHDKMQKVEYYLIHELEKKCKDEKIAFYAKPHPRGESVPIPRADFSELKPNNTLVVSFCSTLMFELAAEGWGVAYIAPPDCYRKLTQNFDKYLFELDVRVGLREQFNKVANCSGIEHFITFNGAAAKDIAKTIVKHVD